MDLKRISFSKFLELYLSEEFDSDNLFCTILNSREISPVDDVNINIDTLTSRIFYVYDDKLSEYQEKIRDVKCEK